MVMMVMTMVAMMMVVMMVMMLVMMMVVMLVMMMAVMMVIIVIGGPQTIQYWKGLTADAADLKDVQLSRPPV